MSFSCYWLQLDRAIKTMSSALGLIRELPALRRPSRRAHELASHAAGHGEVLIRVQLAPALRCERCCAENHEERLDRIESALKRVEEKQSLLLGGLARRPLRVGLLEAISSAPAAGMTRIGERPSPEVPSRSGARDALGVKDIPSALHAAVDLRGETASLRTARSGTGDGMALARESRRAGHSGPSHPRANNDPTGLSRPPHAEAHR
jgi:hypothetical protein